MSQSTKDVGLIKPADLPAPPQTAARIVQACSNREVGAKQLAKIVASDPVLTAEILRTVNSAFFGYNRKVKTAQEAVTVLGNRALRSIALCFAVRDSVRPGAIPGLDTLGYWEDALRRAVAAKKLGQILGLDPEEAFTVGLLQDFGILAMFFAKPGCADRWSDLKPMAPEARRREEREIFGVSHDRVGLMLARTWALPEEIAVPIAFHHASSLGKVPFHLRRMCKASMGADLVAAVYSSADKRKSLDSCHAYLIQAPFQMKVNAIDTLLTEIPKLVEDASSTLGLNIEEQDSFETLMMEANRELAQETMTYQELNWALERTLAEKERLAQELKEANTRLEQLAYFDPLTNLANRRRFLEVSMSEIMRHSRSGQSLTLVMIDLDHFKVINDTYGHPFGDLVLQGVSNQLTETLRTMDLKARIGGEELCVLFPETDRKSGIIGAERSREAIETMGLSTATGPVKVTASLGGVTWSGSVKDIKGAGQVLKQLMDQADTALYRAKKEGRNRVVWAK